MTIWKYVFEWKQINIFEIPGGGRVLSVGVQGTKIVMWVMVRPDQLTQTRRFEIIGTGNPIEVDNGIEREFIGTAQVDEFVWHVFERIS